MDTGTKSAALRWLLATLLFPVAFAAPCAAPEIELNGWRLQQFIKAMDAELGPPYKTIVEDGFTSRAYLIDTHSYMVAGVDADFPNHIATLQLTGTTSKALPFLGLSLGDDKAKVFDVLGMSSATKRIEDWKVTRHEYPDRNYSVELDDQGRLYSIRIKTTGAVVSDIVDQSDPLARLAKALRTGDVRLAMDELRPDIEIYREGLTFDIDRRFHDFTRLPAPEFVRALTGERGVLAAIAGPSPEQRLRLTEKLGVGVVYVFPEGSPLQEIVFFPYAGRYRVYEIAFREISGREAGRRFLGQSTAVDAAAD